MLSKSGTDSSLPQNKEHKNYEVFVIKTHGNGSKPIQMIVPKKNFDSDGAFEDSQKE